MASEIAQHDQQTLLQIARHSIERSVITGQLAKLQADYQSQSQLQTLAASFVTLKKTAPSGEALLRGCIGSLTAQRSLAEDVHYHAFAAACRDTRFTPVTLQELPQLIISISVLSPQQPIAFSSKAELLAKLRPDEDGLVIDFLGKRATFLPAVWQSLPDKHAFLAQLLEKAGLGANFWSDHIAVFRYYTVNFGEPFTPSA